MRQLQKRYGQRALIDVLETRRLMSVSPATGVIVDPPIGVLTVEPITIGTPTLHDITFKAANGRSTLIYASGVTATVYFAGDDVPTIYHHHAIFPAGTVETIDSVSLTNATPGKAMFGFTRLSFGVGTFNIGSITGGDVNTINAPDTLLTGSLVVTSLHHLSLYGVSGAAMSLGNFPTAIKIGQDLTGSLTAQTLGSLSAVSLSGRTSARRALICRLKIRLVRSRLPRESSNRASPLLEISARYRQGISIKV